jgi:hypothetical protein
MVFLLAIYENQDEKKRKQRLECIVPFEDQGSRQQFQGMHLLRQWRETRQN